MKQDYKTIIATFERMAATYAHSRGMEEVNRRELAPVVRKWSGRILDVGAGAGAFIEKYIDPGRHEVFTVDFSWNMLLETRARLGTLAGSSVFPVRALAQSLPFPRDCFDAAVAVNTLHNMPDWMDILQAIAEIARVVRPRGALLLEFRNSNNSTRKSISELFDKPDLPQKSFTFEEIRKTLEQMGLEVEARIPLWGDYAPVGPFDDAVERLKSSFRRMPADRAPRFAVVARKSPGFRSMLRDSLGVPIVER